MNNIKIVVNKQISMILIFNDKNLYEAIINADSKQTNFYDSYFQSKLILSFED